MLCSHYEDYQEHYFDGFIDTLVRTWETKGQQGKQLATMFDMVPLQVIESENTLKLIGKMLPAPA